MADQAANAGDQASNTPEFIQPQDGGLASVNRRLAVLTDAVGRISKPPLMSTGDLIALISALLVLAAAVVGAFAFSDRINNVNEHIDRLEDRMGGRIDRLSDQVMKLNERAAALEGRLSVTPASPPTPPAALPAGSTKP